MSINEGTIIYKKKKRVGSFFWGKEPTKKAPTTPNKKKDLIDKL
jgi:hypothetical protein